MKRVALSSPTDGKAVPSFGLDPSALGGMVQILTEAEAAKLLRLSRRTLQRMRLDGNGPPFLRLTPTGSCIGYAAAELATWASCRSVTSTSAATVAAERAA